MEILGACQAIDLRGDKGLGLGCKVAYDIVREKTATIKEDRVMNIEINKCEDIIKSNVIVEKVEALIGELQ